MPKVYKESWGQYEILDEGPNFKIIKSIVEPNQSLDEHRHNFKTEHWHVLKGKCDIVTSINNDIMTITKCANETYSIGPNVWHQCQNNYDEQCHILEVQYSENFLAKDIERKNA